MPIEDLLQKTDFCPEPMAVLSPDGTINACNGPFAQQLSVASEGLVGTRLDSLAAVSAHAIEEYLHACMVTQGVVQGSLLLQRRADTVAVQARAVAYSARPGASASEILLRLSAEKEQTPESASDPVRIMPARWREIEDSLRRQSQILEVTLASIGEAIIVTDIHGRASFMNTVAEALTGWTSEAAKGLDLSRVFRVISEQNREPLEGLVSKVLRTGVIHGVANHTLLIRRDGREIPIENSAAPIRTATGALFGVVLVFKDVTARRRAEHERGWLAAIVESSNDAIVSKSLDGQITSWNPAAERLFGYTAEETIGNSITLIIPPDLWEEERQILARLRAGERIEHFETIRITRDGRRLEVSLTVSPIKDQAGCIVGASKIARDISERKQDERVVREADRRKDEFLATLSHELRNPLAPIRNAAHILCKKEHSDPQMKLACTIIDRQLRQVTRLVDDLLDISRVTNGGLALINEPFDLRTLLRTLQTSLQPAFTANAQTLRVALPEDPLYVEADRARLMQVFTNLLTNANKYTPDGGLIEVAASRNNDRILVSVRDTGIGIAQEMLDRVFELFAQVDRSSQRSRGGLGIGLTLAQRLIKAQGGRIRVRSEGPEKGSEFVVELPASAAPAPVHAAPPNRAAPVSRKVLVVDDNTDSAVTLAALLGSFGHDTRSAHSGRSALDITETFRPDVVILDIGMPEMDGYETARQLRARYGSQAIRLIALTGWVDSGDRARAEGTGFDAYVVKPSDLGTLVQLIAHQEPI
jgi:PAS domain S-box-containing protein